MIATKDMLTVEELTTEFMLDHSMLIFDSFRQNFLEFPIHFSDPADLSIKLYHAPFLVFSINNSEMPKYNYLNFRAQKAFELNREDINNFLLKDSVPDQLQNNLLGFAKHIRQGSKSANYNGSYISKNGNQFRLNSAYVWALSNHNGEYHGVGWAEPLF